MKDAFDVLMITHSSLCKGYEGALKLILDIDDDDFGTLSFENAESLEDSWEELNIEEICENASRSMVFYNKLLDGGNV